MEKLSQQHQQQVPNQQKMMPPPHTVNPSDPKTKQKLRLTLLAQVLSYK